MPFGLRNDPATFEHILGLILSRVRFKTCLVYLDYVLIFSRKLEDHVKHVDEVITPLDNTSVSLKIRNYQFLRRSLDYLGQVLLLGRMAIAKD